MKSKKGSKVLLLSAGLLFSIFVQAVPGIPMKVKSVILPEKRINIAINDANPGQIYVTITKTLTGEKVFDYTLKNEMNYNRIFDVSNLPEDSYLLTVESDLYIYRANFKLTSLTCKLFDEIRQLKPVFENREGKLCITIPNYTKENVCVIFSNDSGSFFRDEIEQRGFLKRDYNLKMLEPGDYEVDLMAGERSYTYTFEIR